MDYTMAEVSCEKCNIPFEMEASKYEKAEENEQPILCGVCYAALLDEQEKANKPLHRCFEYLVLRAGEFLDKHGGDGWELVSVDRGTMYFKREYFKEAEKC